MFRFQHFPGWELIGFVHLFLLGLQLLQIRHRTIGKYTCFVWKAITEAYYWQTIVLDALPHIGLQSMKVGG